MDAAHQIGDALQKATGPAWPGVAESFSRGELEEVFAAIEASKTATAQGVGLVALPPPLRVERRAAAAPPPAALAPARRAIAYPPALLDVEVEGRGVIAKWLKQGFTFTALPLGAWLLYGSAFIGTPREMLALLVVGFFTDFMFDSAIEAIGKLRPAAKAAPVA